MDRKNKFSKSKLRVFKIWPLLMLVFFSIITAMGWFVSLETGVFMSVFWVIVTIGMLVLHFYARRGIEEDIVGFASDFSQVQRGLLKDLAVPYALLDEGGHFVWCNSAFEAILQKDSILMKNISTFFPNITKETIPRETQVKSVEVRYDERDYKVDLRRISIGPQDEKSNGGKAAKEVFKGAIVSAFFFDVTDINKYIKQNYEMAFVAGYIYMDNYDEAL